MAALAGLTGGSVPEPTEPGPPDPDPAAAAGEGTPAAADLALAENAPGVAELRSEETAPDVAELRSEETAPDVADPGPEEHAPGLADPGPEEAAPVAGTRPARRTSPLVVAAVVLGLIALAGVAVGVLAVATHGFRAKSVVQYRLAAVFSLRPGECLNSTPNGLGVTLLSCSGPHDAEVFARFSLAAPSWPGDAAVQSLASNGCQSRIAGYLNPQLVSAGLAQEYFYPDHAAWRAGVRTVVCEVSASSGQLTGSVRAAG